MRSYERKVTDCISFLTAQSSGWNAFVMQDTSFTDKTRNFSVNINTKTHTHTHTHTHIYIYIYLQERDLWGGLGVDGRTILEWTLKR